MIYKYYVLNIEIINSDYIDEDRSELELDNAINWTGEPSLAWLGSIRRWTVGPVMGVERRGTDWL